MAIPIFESVKAIEQQYRTGEEPALVMCFDMNVYICRYMRSSVATDKLVLIGSLMGEQTRVAVQRYKKDIVVQAWAEVYQLVVFK